MFLLKSIALAQFAFLLMIKGVLAQDTEIDLDAGEQIFSQNCAACHSNGQNVVNPAKTLEIEDLEKYSMNTIDAITYQVKNGNVGGMPKFGERLSEEDIINVANYVLNQAKTNSW